MRQMTLKQKITVWLQQGKNWTKGLALLKEAKKQIPPHWKTTKRPSSLQKSMMEKDLRKIGGKKARPKHIWKPAPENVPYKPKQRDKIHQAPPPEITTEDIPIAARPAIDDSGTDYILDQLAKERQGTFNRREILSGKLADKGLTTQDRQQMWLEIEALNKQLDEIKAKRNHYKKEGSLPEKPKDQITDLLSIKKEIKKAQNNIANNTKKLNDGTNKTPQQLDKIKRAIQKWTELEARLQNQKKSIEKT